jgi:hypothetical protein
VARFEPPEEWPASRRAVIQSDAADAEAQLASLAERIRVLR